MLLTLIAASVAVACSAAARPETSDAAPPAASETLAQSVAPAHYSEENSMHCEVRARHTDRGVELEGFVHADRATSGSYRLVVNGGGANSSEIEQSGEFDAAPGEAVSLGLAEIGGGRIHARLTVEDQSGARCVDEYQS
jgi:hypothetical protein